MTTDHLYVFWINSFFKTATEFRARTHTDPAAVLIPRWSLHALARVPEVASSLQWPTRAMPTPPTLLGLIVVGTGERFEMFAADDPVLKPWEGKIEPLPLWPWEEATGVEEGLRR